MPLFLITRDGADEEEKPRLVSAKTKTKAIKFVVGDMFDAATVDSKTAHAFGVQGVDIEDADAE